VIRRGAGPLRRQVPGKRHKGRSSPGGVAQPRPQRRQGTGSGPGSGQEQNIVLTCWERGRHRDQYGKDDVLLKSGILRGIGKGILLEVLVLEGKGFLLERRLVLNRK
jgi:hypothetical protein